MLPPLQHPSPHCAGWYMHASLWNGIAMHACTNQQPGQWLYTQPHLDTPADSLSSLTLFPCSLTSAPNVVSVLPQPIYMSSFCCSTHTLLFCLYLLTLFSLFPHLGIQSPQGQFCSCAIIDWGRSTDRKVSRYLSVILRRSSRLALTY